MKLGEVIKHRKASIIIDDNVDYMLCRVQLHRRGVVLREVLQGRQIKTKKQQVCKAGDFLVAEMDAKVGGYGFVPKDLDGAIVSSHYFLFELDEEKIRPGFLEVVSKLGLLQEQIKATGSTNYAAIRPANVLDWEIPSLDIEHQIEIENLFAQTTEKSNELSSELTHQLSLVKQLRQAFLREAMQGKLVSQDPNDEPASELLKKIKAEKEQLIKKKKIKKEKELLPIKPEEIPFEIPKSWVWCRLGELLTFGPANGYSPIESKKGTGIKCLTLTATTAGQFNPSYYKFVDVNIEQHSYLWLQENDILIQRGNALDYVGIAALYRGKPFEFIYPDLMIKIRVSNNINPNYIHNCLISKSSRKYFQSNAFGAQKSMPKINQGVVLNALIALPPISEQHRIVRRLDQLMDYCNRLECSIKESQTQNEHLLQQVLREALKSNNEYKINNEVSLAAEP